MVGFLYGLMVVGSIFLIMTAFGKSRHKGLAALSISYHLLLFNAVYAAGSGSSTYLFLFQLSSEQQRDGIFQFSLAAGLLLFAIHGVCKSLEES